MRNEMIFRNAAPTEASAVYALYQSVVGSEFCAWNAFYPGMEEINHDLETENLYVLTDGEQLVGAVSVVPENEMDELTCWHCRDGFQREIARVVIAREFQGRGLSLHIVEEILAVLQTRSCSAVHLSVAKKNIPAYKTYQKAGFQVVGEAELYGGSYYLMEKKLCKSKAVT